MPLINKTVLMSGPDYFYVLELNPYSDQNNQPDKSKSLQEFNAIKLALEQAGVNIIKVDAPKDCQDGIYTANWALCKGNKAILAVLPNARQAETPFAKRYLQDLNKEIIEVPKGLIFSGQGDALACGDYLFMGSGYRTDVQVHDFVAQTLGFNVISLQTIPQLDQTGKPVINKITGWPDSFFYDIDLALSILKPPTKDAKGLIAWCPDAFLPDSQAKIRSLNDIDKIEVSFEEATKAYACNLVSTGKTVIMSAYAPELKANILKHGLKVITPKIHELAKGGGYIRCTTLTLN